MDAAGYSLLAEIYYLSQMHLHVYAVNAGNYFMDATCESHAIYSLRSGAPEKPPRQHPIDS